VATPAGTIELMPSTGRLEQVASVDPSTVPTPPPLVDFPLGVLRFRITDVPAGASVQLQIDSPVEVTRYWKLVGSSWTELPTTPIPGGIVVTLVDGGLGDADGLANGVIVDPGAPGRSLTGALPQTGNDVQRSLVLALAAMAFGALLLASRRRGRHPG
jgi:LPXTG-motif cell wall-anchored protein